MKGPNMSTNLANLLVRFILEMAALLIFAYRGWTIGSGIMRFAWGILFPVAGAILWGTFRVPGDASHSGDAPVPVPGWARLTLELVIFTAATWGLVTLANTKLAAVFGVIVGLHYLVSWDRIVWLLRPGASGVQPPRSRRL
jgi:hypothetical protein